MELYSGLTKLTVTSLPMTDGVNPFEAMSMMEILALDGVQTVDIPLTPDNAGTQKEITMVVMNLGGTQAFAAACAD